MKNAIAIIITIVCYIPAMLSHALFVQNESFETHQERSDSQSTIPIFKPGTPHYSLQVPLAIVRPELLNYFNTLNLDEVQRVIARTLYEEYLEKEGLARDRMLTPLLIRSADLLAVKDSLDSKQHVEQFTALMNDRTIAADKLAKHDAEFFAELEQLLSEDQLPHLERVRLQRNRARWSEIASVYHFGQIDLAILMHDLPEMKDVSQSTQNALNNLMAEYDNQITPLFKRRYRASYKATLEITALLAPLIQRPGDPPLEPEEFHELTKLAEQNFEQIKKLNRAYIRPAKRIHSLNQNYFISLGKILPESAFNELSRRFQQKAYRSIYPNPFDVLHILKAALDIEKLSSEQREVLEVQYISYAQQSSQICAQMESKYLPWLEVMAESQQKPRDKLEAYKKDMLELDMERQEAAETALSIVEDFLNPEQLSIINGLLVGYRIQLAQAEELRDYRLSR